MTATELIFLRTRAGLLWKALGRELGVAYSTVCRWERRQVTVVGRETRS